MKKPGHSLGEAERERLATLPPAKRFKERGGYTCVTHNLVAKLLARIPQTFTATVAILHIYERTFGTEGNPAWVRITSAEIEALTCTSAQSFAEALTLLVKHGIVERRGSAAKYEYRLWPEEWESLPLWRDVEAAEAAKAAELEAAKAAEKPAPAEPVVVHSGVIKSGKTAAPVVLKVTLAGAPGPIEVPFQARNESGFDMSVLTSVKGGTIFTTFVRSEEKAKPFQADLKRNGAKSLSLQQYTDFEKQEYRQYIIRASVGTFGIAPTDSLVEATIKAAYPTPLDVFETVTDARLKKRRRDDGPGLFRQLAEDALRTWRAIGVIDAGASEQTSRPRRDPSVCADCRGNDVLVANCLRCSGSGLAADACSDEEYDARLDRAIAAPMRAGGD